MIVGAAFARPSCDICATSAQNVAIIIFNQSETILPEDTTHTNNEFFDYR